RRVGVRRRGEDQVSGRLEGTEALASDRPAAQGLNPGPMASRKPPPETPDGPGDSGGGFAEPGTFPIDPPVEPMLAKIASELPVGEGVLYEPKWDGFRAIVFRGETGVYIQ